MEMNKLPINELRKLLAAVSEHGERHLDEVEADLQQTSFLLNEAIEKLSASFMTIHGLLMEQQSLLEGAQAEIGIAPSMIKQLDAFKENIGSEVNNVVTGLQFQDMTNQLIHRTIKRVNGLKELLQTLAEHGYDMDANREHEEIAQFLDAINHHFHEGSHALTGNLRKSVGQNDMTTGEIDLF